MASKMQSYFPLPVFPPVSLPAFPLIQGPCNILVPAFPPSNVIKWLQHETMKGISGWTTAPDVLVAKFPLDSGRHTFCLAPSTTLGTLNSLPKEVQHQIVRHMDVKTLFTFRRVSQLSVELVSSLTEFQKIIDNAPNAFRMAIAARTHHTFTIVELFDTLCKRECAYCGKLAPFIDVCLMKRVCLGMEGYCKKHPLPLPKGHAHAKDGTGPEAAPRGPVFRLRWTPRHFGWKLGNSFNVKPGRLEVGPDVMLRATIPNRMPKEVIYLSEPSTYHGSSGVLIDYIATTTSAIMVPWLFAKDVGHEGPVLCLWCRNIKIHADVHISWWTSHPDIARRFYEHKLTGADTKVIMDRGLLEGRLFEEKALRKHFEEVHEGRHDYLATW